MFIFFSLVFFYHASFLYIVDLYLLIAVVIAKILNQITELVVPIGMPTKAEAEIKTHPVLVELKNKKVFNKC